MDPINLLIALSALGGLGLSVLYWRRRSVGQAPKRSLPPAEGNQQGLGRSAAAEPTQQLSVEELEMQSGYQASQPPAGRPDHVRPSQQARDSLSGARPSVARTPPVPPALDETRVRSENAEALRQSLQATRGGLWQRVLGIFASAPSLDAEALAPLQEALIAADVGPKTSEKMLQGMQQAMLQAGDGSPAFAARALKDQARRILAQAESARRSSPPPAHGSGHRTRLTLVVGVNGVGKTTTIGKLASLFARRQQRVLLVAADTFRAAAVAQLEAWGRRVQCDVIKGGDRADPSSVVFDAIHRGMAAGADQILVDTAGRLHTQSPLMDELSKVYRTAEKALGQRSPDEVLLVVDATNGQNALQQAKMFCAALPVSGIALTKLDGSAKGGIVLAIADEYRLPVRYVGVGEKIEDLRQFDGEAFLDALFSPDSSAGTEL